MTYQLLLYVAGMAWGVIAGLWLAWIWRHQKPTPNSFQEGNDVGCSPQRGNNVGETPVLPETDVEEQRRNRAEMAAQPENQARILKAMLRAAQKDREAMFVLMGLGLGKSQANLCQLIRFRRES